MRGVMRVVVAFVVFAACVAVGRSAAGTDLRPGMPTTPTALVWGAGLFFDRPAFEQWLREHNKSYDSWATLHPAARSILENPVEPVRFRPPPTPVKKALSLPYVPAAKAGSGIASALLLLLGAIGLVLVTVSLLPLRRLAPASSVAVALGERRLGVSAGGIAIIVGFVVAKLTS
jgi:hypothetical protein